MKKIKSLNVCCCLSIESWNHQGRKRPPHPVQPSPYYHYFPLNHVPQYSISPFFEHFEGWWLHLLPGQCGPMHYHWEENFLHIQPENALWEEFGMDASLSQELEWYQGCRDKQTEVSLLNSWHIFPSPFPASITAASPWTCWAFSLHTLVQASYSVFLCPAALITARFPCDQPAVGTQHPTVGLFHVRTSRHFWMKSSNSHLNAMAVT